MKTLTKLEPWRLPNGRNNTVEAVFSEVEAAFGYGRGALSGRDRTQPKAWARQVAMSICRELANLSLNEIGRLVGRDHGTVIHACKAVSDLTSIHPKLKAEIDQLRARIQAKINTPT